MNFGFEIFCTGFFEYSVQKFLVGVCRFADSGLGPLPLGDYLPSSSVLHRL